MTVRQATSGRYVVDDSEQAMVERLFLGTVAALEVLSVALGDRLGLYATLREDGPSSAGELADRAAIHPRHAREWLKQQTVAGFLTVDDPDRDPQARVYSPPDARVATLADRDSLDHVAPLARLVAGVAHPMEAVAHAYRTGVGVPWDANGADAREGQAYINRPAFLQLLPEESRRRQIGADLLILAERGRGGRSCLLRRREPEHYVRFSPLGRAR